VVGAPLLAVHQPGSGDRLEERGAHVGRQRVGGRSQRLGRHPQRAELDAVEAQRRLADRRRAMLADGLDDRPHRLGGGGHVDGGAGQ
jgi:hypothetical protein